MRRFILSITAVFIVCGCITVKAGAYSAAGMVLIEKDSNAVLINKNADKQLPMASTTKIMTAVVVLENAKLDDKVKIPQQAVGIEGSSMYLQQGEVLTVNELLYGLMLTSGNDAAQALAWYVGNGSVLTFVRMMNDKAKELGLKNTNFANPSGLPDDNHYTTPYELAIITSYAMHNEVFSKIASTSAVKISYKGIANGRTLKNHNKLLNMYDGAVGVKTGFTKKAGRCLVGAATRDGVTLICVTLNDGNDWQDHIEAFDYGFTRTKRVCIAKKDEVSVTVHTPDGKSVVTKNTDDIYAVLIDNCEVSQTIYTDEFIYAPRIKGDITGKVKYSIGNIYEVSSKLYLTEDIQAPVKKELYITRLIKRLLKIFGRKT